MRMDGRVNLMKGAMLTANAVTTVSPTYAAQLHDPAYACGLEQVVHLIDYKLSGVLNGLDIESYNPAHDGSLPRTFDPDHMEGKAVCKAELQRQLGLAQEPDTPLMAIVSRLVSHKGLDLICEVLHDMMELPLQLVVLGKGDRKYEDFFGWAAQQYPGRMAVRLDYNEDLSMAIYAGADLFLMPSKSEPCGLSQMIAMRYGTVPVVRQTGGLADSVEPYNRYTGEGTGFGFLNFNAHELLFTTQAACRLYTESPVAWGNLAAQGMAKDFSWRASALEYRKLYRGLFT